MAVRFILASSLIENSNMGIYKPSSTLGHHQIQFVKLDNGNIAVRGIGKEKFVPIHLDGALPIEEVAKLPRKGGQLGQWEPQEISPWKEVHTSDVLRYDCGKIIICKGQFAVLKRAELLGDKGAHEAMKKYLFDRWLSKEARATDLSIEEVKILFEDANLSYGWKPKIERISTPHKEWDGPAEDPNYRGYRLMLETTGSQCYEQSASLLSRHRVWKRINWAIDPYNRAYGYTNVGVTYYVL